MHLTERHDLRGGRPCWQDPDTAAIASDPPPKSVDIAIVGAGIMGAMLAERLQREGHAVALVDRRGPALGSTAASTALVMWAADLPLIHLIDRIGAERAPYAWRRVRRSVLGLDALVHRIDPDDRCHWRPRPELYLAGTLLDAAGLRAEARVRRAAGLPSTFLDPDAVAVRFGLPPRAALLSRDTYSVDPVALTLALLGRARRAGAALSFPAEVVGLDQSGDAVILRLADGARIGAAHVIIATGYEAARWYLPPAFALSSSYAIATAPATIADDAPGWNEQALIWEAATRYLYARATVDGRIIVGGEDEDVVDAAARDALLQAKRGSLEARGAALLGRDHLVADRAWSATFGRSPDGLPAIGRARNGERVWLAAGFGGNGIAFAGLAADLIAADLAGVPDPDADLFDPYRFE